MSRGFGTTFGAATTDVVVANYTTTASGKRTYSAWVYAKSNGGGGLARVWHKGTSTATTFDLLSFNNNILQMGYFRGAAITQGQWNFNLPSLNAWHHLFLNYDASSSSNVPNLWINGISTSFLGGATQPNGTLTTTSEKYAIGNRPSDNARCWDGMLAWITMWDGVLLGGAEAMAIAMGVNPVLINPEFIGMCLPLDGVNSPEPDFSLGTSSSITGTRLGTIDPPVQPHIRLRKLFEHYSNAPAATFQAAWAARQGAVIGGGVYV